jgi:hypothetical protein
VGGEKSVRRRWCARVHVGDDEVDVFSRHLDEYVLPGPVEPAHPRLGAAREHRADEIAGQVGVDELEAGRCGRFPGHRELAHAGRRAPGGP